MEAKQREDFERAAAAERKKAADAVILKTRQDLEQERGAIKATVRLYAEAYRKRNVEGMKKVWPSLSGPRKETLDALVKFLNETTQHNSTIEYDLRLEDPSVDGNQATVQGTFSTSYTEAGLRKKRTVSGLVTVTLTKKGQWLIESLVTTSKP